MGLFDFLTQEIAIDLGTANTLIISNDKVVVDEPSIVAIDRTTGKVIAVGKQAMLMHGKTHENIKTVRPLKDGVIADFDAAEHMIRGMIKMLSPKGSLFTPSLAPACSAESRTALFSTSVIPDGIQITIFKEGVNKQIGRAHV